MSPGWGEEPSGPEGDTRLCPAGREESLGAGLGGSSQPGRSRPEIRKLPAHRILEVVGVVRAERLQSEQALREGWDEGWVRRGVVRHPAGAGLQGRHLSACQHRLGRPFQALGNPRPGSR